MKKLTLTFLFCLFYFANVFAMENAFYILHGSKKIGLPSIKKPYESLRQHANSIAILISQAYQIKSDGSLTGFINPDVLLFAREQKMKIMALVTNAGFHKEKTQAFLSNNFAQRKAINTLLKTCQQNHFYGVQFDFEGIPIKNKNALTRFYESATDILHKNGFKVSFAVVPFIPEIPDSSEFLRRRYENWAGVYDLKVLGQIGDFVSLMSYDQHTEGTTPGATAQFPWVEETIQYTLKFIPSKKLSLGIPTYSLHWYTGKRGKGHLGVNVSELNYDQVLSLKDKNKFSLLWDPTNKIHFAIYDRLSLNEYLFVEDGASFQAKRDLAKKYNLRGLSVFTLGNEDPDMWNHLSDKLSDL